jgi:DNA-directed RNA polymerase specialized sigma24 family protein
VTAEARERLLDYIARPSTHSALQAYVRRRGLADSADDVVQTVLCDALMVEAVPDRASELPRFVTGIARNKVVDEQRRRARWKQAELPDDLEGQRPSDARELLRRIERDVVDPDDRRALSWMIREHAGDSLYLQALEQALSPTTLRQRVCRLRKALRARYLAPALIVALGLGSALARHISSSDAISVAAPASPELASYAGEWRVVAVTPARFAGLAHSVRVTGDRVLLRGPAGASRELNIAQLSDDRAVLRSGGAEWTVHIERPSSGRLRLSGPRGSVELERQR